MLLFDGYRVELRGTNKDRTWEIPELLGAYNPFGEEDLYTQNKIFADILLYAAELYDRLSETARLHYDFWKNFQPDRVKKQNFKYVTVVSETRDWELDVNHNGLYFKDVSGDYGYKGAITSQCFSDFWFYGPILPIPDLQMRKQIVANLRNTFRQVGGPAYQGHFELFEYPIFPNPIHWKFGDHVASDFVILRNYGIEYGSENWHDGLVYLQFISFEHCIFRNNATNLIFTEEVRQEILQKMRRVRKPSTTLFGVEREENEVSKRLFMENGGQIHRIHLDGFGDVYKATPEEEARWREELIANYKERLKVETNEVVLKSLVESLRYLGVSDMEKILIERAAQANSRDRQTIAIVLWNDGIGEESTDVLLSLLAEEDPDSYWRDFVFSSLLRRRKSEKAREWLVGCLDGDNPVYFRKAVDIFVMWAFNGEIAVNGKQLGMALTLENRANATDEYLKMRALLPELIVKNLDQ